jgi:hypothetical protein
MITIAGKEGAKGQLLNRRRQDDGRESGHFLRFARGD